MLLVALTLCNNSCARRWRIVADLLLRYSKRLRRLDNLTGSLHGFLSSSRSRLRLPIYIGHRHLLLLTRYSMCFDGIDCTQSLLCQLPPEFCVSIRLRRREKISMILPLHRNTRACKYRYCDDCAMYR